VNARSVGQGAYLKALLRDDLLTTDFGVRRAR
jgi:hypothetical protein